MKILRRCAAGLSALAGIALVGCQQGPSQVSIRLLSPDPVSSGDWKTEKNESSYSSNCSVKGTVAYDVQIEPEDFTGQVATEGAIVEYAGSWKDTDSYFDAYFVDGKLVFGGVRVGKYVYKSQDDKEEYKAVCAVNKLNQVKLISIGKPIIATPGIKLIAKEAEKK